MHGRGAAPTQATRYTTQEGVVLPTGEIAKRHYPGIPLFQSYRFYFPELKEIDTYIGKTLFERIKHKIWGLPSWIKHLWNGIKLQGISKYKGHSYNGYVINSEYASLGQSTDINAILDADQKIKSNEALASKSRVYFGTSRGAAATFSAISRMPVDSQQKIKACILEAPPSSLSGLFKDYGNRLGLRAFGKWIYLHFSQFFLGKQHLPVKELQARGHVDRFPHHIPLLIVSSVADTIVTHKNTIRLALHVAVQRKKAILNGETNVAPVFFLQLDKANHNSYYYNNREDTERYLFAVHAMCKLYDLPYIKAYAEKGSEILAESNLLSDSYTAFLSLQDEFWQEKSNREVTRKKAFQQCMTDEKNRPISIMYQSPLFSKVLKKDDTVNPTQAMQKIS